MKEIVACLIMSIRVHPRPVCGLMIMTTLCKCKAFLISLVDFFFLADNSSFHQEFRVCRIELSAPPYSYNCIKRPARPLHS